MSNQPKVDNYIDEEKELIKAIEQGDYQITLSLLTPEQLQDLQAMLR